VYGEIADVFMINPYQMYYFSEQPFRNSEYIALAKRASEPRLLWSIPEAFTHEDNIRFPTPEEERLIVYSEIGEGSKGILYFTSDQRLGYPANVDLESAISGLNQELRLLRSYLVISEPFSLVIKKPDLIKTYSLVCGDKAIVILLLNNNIKSQFEVGKQPFVYQPQRNVQITCQIPKWLKILKVQEVEKHCIKNVPYVIKGNQLTLTIKNLDISRQYLIKTTPAQRGKY
jgi:hypothetical protein